MAIASSNLCEHRDLIKAVGVVEKVNGLHPSSLHVRDIEMVRLIGQYLCDKGYRNAYDQLAKDSGIVLEPQPATDLRAAILSGNWEATEKAIEELAPTISNPTDVAHIRFHLLEQQFLELLEAEKVIPALILLRNRITPLQPDPKRLQNLAQCLMCRTPEEVRAHAGGWSGINGGSRSVLVDCIQRFMPAQTMLPPGGLETLVKEAVRSQLNTCTFHMEPIHWPDALESTSLLQPHTCSVQDFPVFQVQRIDHSDSELYFCVFSPNGKYLATGGKETSVNIWKVDPVTHTIHTTRTLFTCETSINHICWSPDSKKLAVCCGSRPGPILVFDVATRRQLCQKQEKNEDVYCAATFFSDSRKLAFGGLKGGCFYIIDTEDEGKVLITQEYCRVQSMTAILTPPSPTAAMMAATLAAGLTPSTDIDLDSKNSSTAAATLEQLLSPIDQLLVVDHMYRIRLFKFGLTAPGTGESESGTGPGSSSASRGRLTLPQEVFFPTASTWANTAVGSGGSLSPILLALQNALVPLPSGGRSAGLGLPAGSVGDPGGLSRDPRGSSLSHQVILQAPPNPSSPGFALLAINRDGSTSSVSSLGGPMSLRISESGSTGVGTAESIFQIASSSDPTLYSPAVAAAASVRPSAIIARIMQNHGVGRSASPSTATSSRGGSGTLRTTVGATMTSTIQEANPETAEVSTNTEAAGGVSTGAQTNLAANSTSISSAGPNVQVYSLLNQATLIKEIHPIQSIVVSPSAKRLLVGLNAKGLVLWDLESQGIIQRFYGYHQIQQKLFYTFCGTNEDFVACGSENGLMHLWHVGGPTGGRPIHSVLAANSNETAVTGVHWNPAIPTMMASVNDDGEIRIWGPAKYANGGA